MAALTLLINIAVRIATAWIGAVLVLGSLLAVLDTRLEPWMSAKLSTISGQIIVLADSDFRLTTSGPQWRFNRVGVNEVPINSLVIRMPWLAALEDGALVEIDLNGLSAAFARQPGQFWQPTGFYPLPQRRSGAQSVASPSWLRFKLRAAHFRFDDQIAGYHKVIAPLDVDVRPIAGGWVAEGNFYQRSDRPTEENAGFFLRADLAVEPKQLYGNFESMPLGIAHDSVRGLASGEAWAEWGEAISLSFKGRVDTPALRLTQLDMAVDSIEGQVDINRQAEAITVIAKADICQLGQCFNTGKVSFQREQNGQWDLSLPSFKFDARFDQSHPSWPGLSASAVVDGLMVSANGKHITSAAGRAELFAKNQANEIDAQLAWSTAAGQVNMQASKFEGVLWGMPFEYQQSGFAAIELDSQALALNGDIRLAGHQFAVKAAGNLQSSIDVSAHLADQSSAALFETLLSARLPAKAPLKAFNWLASNVESRDTRAHLTWTPGQPYQLEIIAPRMTLKPAVQWSRLPIDQFNLRLSKGGPITLTGERIHLGNDLVSGPVKAKIENPKAPWLDFETTVDSSYAAQAAFLRRSPLASKVEGALSAIDTAARLNTKIVLRQPLKKTLGAPDFRVTTAFEGADITLKAADISLVNSSGAVEIVPKRVYAEDLAFNYLGQRFRGDFELKDGVLEANAAGEAYLSRVLKQWFEPLAKGVTGKTPVEIALSMDLAKKPGDFELAVSTALTGVTRRWPAPARKLNPNQAAAETFSAIKTNGQLKFALKNSNGNVVLTQLGSNQWDGSVSCRTLDPLGWAGFFAGGGGNAGLSLKLKVDCDQMALGNQRIPNPTAQLFIENAVQVSVDADGLNGSIGVDAAGAVVARFADMDTRFWQTAEDISIGDALSSADLPRLTLGIDSAHVAGYPLQQVNLSAIPDGEVWNIQWAQAAVAGARFSATGLVSGGTSARTSVQWSADIDNAQTALTQLGYSVQISGQGEAEGTLGWVGFPWQVDKNRLNGELRVNLKKGALRDVDPGAGKLLALLNIARLPARFANSVSDLEQGFTFDQLAARVQLVPGFAYNDPVVIQGPVAVVEMRGSTDLNSEQVLQEVLVVPSLTSSVPLVGLLAGGPVTGIGAFIVERLLGEAGIDFNQVAAQRYSVTGTLDNPQMVQQ